MGELEVITFLEKNKGRFFSEKEISSNLSHIANPRCIRFSIRSLTKRNEIKYVKVPPGIARRIFGDNTKRGVTLYYLDQRDKKSWG